MKIIYNKIQIIRSSSGIGYCINIQDIFKKPNRLEQIIHINLRYSYGDYIGYNYSHLEFPKSYNRFISNQLKEKKIPYHITTYMYYYDTFIIDPVYVNVDYEGLL
jgi:hypothetical protein